MTYIKDFVAAQTEGFQVAVELGAGQFDKIDAASTPLKVGVEIFEPYIMRYKPSTVIAIHGNMLDYREILEQRFLGRESVCLVLDSLEHLEREDGEQLLDMLQQDFGKVLVVTPEGFIPQTHDAWKMGNEEYQTHRSGWSKTDLESWGFDVHVTDRLLYGVWP